MKAGLLGMLLLTLVTTATPSQAQLDELIARAKSFELDTPHVPPPGEPLTHHAAVAPCELKLIRSEIFWDRATR